MAYPYFLLGRALVGLVGTFGLAVLTMWLLREGSTQAATGFLYTAVLTVAVGELIARFLFQPPVFPSERTSVRSSSSAR